MGQQIGITTNPNYKLLGKTVDGMITMGEVDQYNVTSGIKLRVGNVGSPTPHYIQMDKDGDAETKARQGTIVRCPGAFQVKSGDLVGAGIPGVYIESGNGDIVLKSAGRIRIEAEDIDILATGSGNKNGVVNIEGNTVVAARSDRIHVEGKSKTFIFSDGTTELIGNSLVNLYGKSIEMLDSTSGFRGSTGYFPTPWTPREFQQAIAEYTRELKDTNLIGRIL